MILLTKYYFIYFYICAIYDLYLFLWREILFYILYFISHLVVFSIIVTILLVFSYSPDKGRTALFIQFIKQRSNNFITSLLVVQ